MKTFAIEKTSKKEGWFVLDFCQLGFIGESILINRCESRAHNSVYVIRNNDRDITAASILDMQFMNSKKVFPSLQFNEFANFIFSFSGPRQKVYYSLGLMNKITGPKCVSGKGPSILLLKI